MVTAPFDTGPAVAPTSANVSATHGQSFAASSLFTYADPFGDAATQHDVWDTDSGGGHFALNGSALGVNQGNFVSSNHQTLATRPIFHKLDETIRDHVFRSFLALVPWTTASR